MSNAVDPAMHHDHGATGHAPFDLFGRHSRVQELGTGDDAMRRARESGDYGFGRLVPGLADFGPHKDPSRQPPAFHPLIAGFDEGRVTLKA
jgi:hypothetical protein